MAELVEGQFLDLTHPFAGELEAQADLVEGQRAVLAQPEVQAQDFGLAGIETGQHHLDVFPQGVLHDLLLWVELVFIGQVVEQALVLGFVEGGVQGADRLPVDQGVFDFLGAQAQGLGNALGSGGRPLLLEGLAGAGDLGQQVEAVDRHPHRGLLGEGLEDGLADPPHGVGDELEAPGLVETLGGGDQAHVPGADQLGERQAAVLVFLGHPDHEAQVGLDQGVAGFAIALADAAGQDRYARARETYQRWLSGGAIVRERRPAYYLMRQRFSHRGAEHTRLALFAAVRLEEFEKGIRKFWPDGASAKGLAPVDGKTRFRRGETQIKKEIEQVHLCLGMPGLPVVHDDRFVLHLISNYLGGGMSSRLFQEVREKRGMAYSIYTFVQAYRDIGFFGIYCGTSPNRIDKVTAIVKSELERVADKGLSTKRLGQLKRQVRGSFLLGLEKTGFRMNRLGVSHIYFGRTYAVDEVLARIDTINNDDVLRVAGELFREDFHSIAVVGPK